MRVEGEQFRVKGFWDSSCFAQGSGPQGLRLGVWMRAIT